MDAVERAVLAAIDEAAVVQLASELIAIPSVSTQETPAQEHVAGLMTVMGGDVDRWTIDVAPLSRHPDYSAEFERDAPLGVVGSFGGRDASLTPALLIDAHVDVVPPGDAGDWTTAPFAPAVRDGRLYGRGACDTKGGLAAALHAIDAIGRAGVRLGRTVALTSVVGEEDGGSGTLATLLHGVVADACIVVEPTELSIVPAVAGALSYRIRVRGLSAHGAMREEGISAIEKSSVVQHALLDLETQRNARLTDPLFAWLNTPFAICTGKIAGGDWPSSEADWLVMEGRYGVAPGEDLAAARLEFEEAVAKAAAGDPWLASRPPTVTWWGGQFFPARTDPDHPLVTTMTESYRAATGAEPRWRGMPYGCDMGLIARVAAIPTVVFGPGDIRAAHRPDEHVPVADLVACARTFAVAIVRSCEGELS